MTRRFSYWKRHNPLFPVYEAEFLKWIHHRVDLIKNRTVLDAGCGMARNSVFCAKYGAKSVLGIEINEDVIPAAQENASLYENVMVEQGDLQQLDVNRYAERFDTVICIGVLHHLPNPKAALENLLACLRPEGHFIAMVYAYEGNEAYLRLLRPVRVVTKRLPLAALEVLALPVTAMYRLLLPTLKGEYFELQRQSPFSALHYNIVDQLCPDIAHYWTKDEVLSLIEPYFHIDEIVHTNGRTWTVVGKKRPVGPECRESVSATALCAATSEAEAC